MLIDDLKKTKMTSRQIVGIVIILIATTLISLLPNAKIEYVLHTSYNYYFDLFQHSSYYFAMTLVVCWLFPAKKPRTIGALMFALSLALEFAQLLAPKRSFSPHDIVMNLTGTLLATLLCYGFRSVRRGRLAPGT